MNNHRQNKLTPTAQTPINPNNTPPVALLENRPLLRLKRLKAIETATKNRRGFLDTHEVLSLVRAFDLSELPIRFIDSVHRTNPGPNDPFPEPLTHEVAELDRFLRNRPRGENVVITARLCAPYFPWLEAKLMCDLDGWLGPIWVPWHRPDPIRDPIQKFYVHLLRAYRRWKHAKIHAHPGPYDS